MTIWKQLDRETVREVFRARVLAALDAAAVETFDPLSNPRSPGSLPGIGATDADLPRLFAALDYQIEVLADRYNTALTEPVS